MSQYQPGSGDGQPNPGYAPPQHPLSGTRPASATNQILYWLLDGLIFGIPIMILTLLGLIPYFMNLFNVMAQPRGLSEGAQEQQFSQLMGSMLIVVGVFALAMLVYFVVFSWFIAVNGQTPGMRILGLRLVSVHTGQPVGWKLALLRNAVLILGNQFTGGILGLLFWLSPLFDTQSGWNQSWQDKMVKAVLINVKEGRDTFQA